MARSGSWDPGGQGQKQARKGKGGAYILSGDLGYWQAALRDPIFELIADAVGKEHLLALDLLCTDQVGGQRTRRFALVPGDDGWRAAVAWH